MRRFSNLSCWFSLAICVLTSSSSLIVLAQTNPENRSLGTVARELRANKNVTQPANADSLPSQTSAQGADSAVVNDSQEVQRFMDQTRALLMREEFAELDKVADTARASKARFPGGVWKLERFYEAITNRHGGGEQTDANWQSHLALIQRWVTARPKSTTARVAFADAHLGYAWAARGNGYANTVTEQGWQLFEERVNKAKKILDESASLTPKCPYWYELMQEIARTSGADREQQRTIFEKAAAFEPLYYAYYQQYAFLLLPKWGGEPGEAEAFAEETY